MLWIIPLKQNTPQSPEPTMRQERTVQATVFDIFAEHEIGRELNAMSRWLDQQRSLLSLVAADLSGHGIKETAAADLCSTSSLKPVIQPIPNASCRCWSVISRARIRRHDKQQATAAMPASPISNKRKPWAWTTSCSTRSAALRSMPWPRADGCIASFETFVPASKQTSHA